MVATIDRTSARIQYEGIKEPDVFYEVSASPPDGYGQFDTWYGLKPGVSYVFRVRAYREDGTGPVLGDPPQRYYGPASAPSNPVVAYMDPPTAPTDVGTYARHGGVLVTWLPPTDLGGGAITSYRVVATPMEAGVQTVSALTDQRELLMSGLENERQYAITVNASNLSKEGPSSVPSLVTPTAGAVPPDRVTGVTGVADAEGSIRVSWTPPVNDGDAPITHHLITVFPNYEGGTPFSLTSGSESTASVSGLLLGHSYAFRVVAVNAGGESPPSAESNQYLAQARVTAAPSQVTAVVAGTDVQVSWYFSNPNATIDTYTIEAQPGGKRVTISGLYTSALFEGLAAGGSYSFTVFASSVLGDGPVSAPSNTVTIPL